ncbi:hypothetical protein FACS189483_06730 [Spirochaetia bacterium]|nr:hypothetical protein FACS189483_06730 [Spirochaetia bacterium]
MVLAIVFALLSPSCATVGQFRPVSDGYEVIGTIQTAFTVRDSWLKKNETINTQAYIKLLEAAAQKHTEDTVVTPNDIAYINITLTGENGVVESNDDRKLTVTVEGGELLGFGSANPCTVERFDSGEYTTYYGKAFAVVRAAQGEAAVMVHAAGDGFAPVTTKITVE